MPKPISPATTVAPLPSAGIFRQAFLRWFHEDAAAPVLHRVGFLLGQWIRNTEALPAEELLRRQLRGVVTDALFLIGLLRYEVDTRRFNSLAAADVLIGKEAKRLAKKLEDIVERVAPVLLPPEALETLPEPKAWEELIACHETILCLVSEAADRVALRQLLEYLYRYGLEVGTTSEHDAVSPTRSAAQAAIVDLQYLARFIRPLTSRSDGQQRQALLELAQRVAATADSLSVRLDNKSTEAPGQEQGNVRDSGSRRKRPAQRGDSPAKTDPSDPPEDS